MMGVYIKGMEMPRNCDDCRLGIDCAYDASQDGYKMMGGRPHNCPLVHVPDHGRLIDADALDASLGIDDRDDWVHWTLESAPTIIPASEEGE